MTDLLRLWDEVFEASADPETADAYVDGLRAEIRKKTSYPRSGHSLEYNGLFTGFYWVRYKRYLAFYRVHENRMEVARVLFERQDYLTILINELGKLKEEQNGGSH